MATVTAATTVLYPTPPPTVNALNHYQRSRLMKSTQKLGKVLGTTPYLLESSELPITLLPVGRTNRSATTSRRERSALTHSASSSTSSFGSDSPMLSRSPSLVSLPSSNGSSDVLPMPRPAFSDAKHGRSKGAPAPLFIRLNTVPASPVSSSLPPTPSTETPCSATKYTFPPTPCTPTFDQSEVKRKRMAKLARHLGESIPPHLISGTPIKSPKVGAASARKRRSMSAGGIDSVPELGFSQHKPAVSYCPEPQLPVRQQSWIGSWNRDDMNEVQKQLRALR